MYASVWNEEEGGWRERERGFCFFGFNMGGEMIGVMVINLFLFTLRGNFVIQNYLESTWMSDFFI